MEIDTHNDHNFNRNSPTSIHAIEQEDDDIENLTDLEYAEREVGEYQRKYMDEKAEHAKLKQEYGSLLFKMPSIESEIKLMMDVAKDVENEFFYKKLDGILEKLK